MRAVAYEGSHKMKVITVPDPTIQEADDVIVRVTATAICGSDLHMYNGNMPPPIMQHGDVMGHEFMGIVEEVGPAVTAVKKGDRVVVPFTIACGHCFFCDRQLTSACENTNPDHGALMMNRQVNPPSALYGYSHLYGGTPGGQAEFVRVRKANFNAFKVPDGLTDEQVLFMTDILPTGYQAIVNAEVGPGSSVVIFGAGPVGQMTALSARLRGVEQVFIVDDVDYRLEFARETYGATPIDMHAVDNIASYLAEHTNNRGVDAAIDAVGFEAKGNILESAAHNLMIQTGRGNVLRDCIASVRRGGVVSIPGVYVGFLHGFMIGDAFDKGLTFKMGQTHVHRYLPELLRHIQAEAIHPEAIISHRLPLEDAPEAYKLFAEHKDNCRKVVLYPGGVPTR